LHTSDLPLRAFLPGCTSHRPPARLPPTTHCLQPANSETFHHLEPLTPRLSPPHIHSNAQSSPTQSITCIHPSHRSYSNSLSPRRLSTQDVHPRPPKRLNPTQKKLLARRQLQPPQHKRLRRHSEFESWSREREDRGYSAAGV
jgi:hypothetical protein